MEGRRLATTLATIYTAKLGMNTATRFVYPFLPAIARGLGVSLEAVGLLIAVRWLAGLATPVVVRLLAPGEQRRRLALIGLALGSAGAAITTFGLFGLAVAGFILMGIGEPVADVAFQAFLGDEVPYERRARAISLVELAWGSALLVGAPVAGWLLSVWGWQTPFGVIAIALALLIWPVSRQLGAGHDPTHHRSVSRGRLRLDRSMVAFLGAAAAFAFAAEISFVVFGAWLEEAFDASLVALGSTAIFIAIGELLGEGASIGFTDRIGKRRAVVVGLATSTVGYLAVSAANTYLLGVLAFAMALAGFEVAIVSAIPLATELFPQGRAKFLALMVMVMGVSRAVGTAVGVPIFISAGLSTNMAIAAIANGVAIGLLVFWVRERSPSDEASAV